MSFQRWLAQNSEKLRSYAPDEVARLALACGFTMSAIAPEVTNWLSRSRRRLKLWESPFHELWVRAMFAQMGKDD